MKCLRHSSRPIFRLIRFQKTMKMHEAETPPSMLQPGEQKLKDAVMRLFMSRYSSESPLLQHIKSSQLETCPTHPPYATMVIESIKELNEQGGSNLDEISKYIERNFHGTLPFAHSKFLKRHLTNLVHSGEILYSYSNACYTLPDLNPGHEKQQQQEEKKKNWGRLSKICPEGDGLMLLCPSNNEEDLMGLGKKGEKHRRVDYSNIVLGLAAHPLQQQQLMEGTRPSRLKVNQQEIVEQHHQFVCANRVQETGKRRGRRSLPKVRVHQKNVVEQCNPNGDSSAEDETEEGTSQQRQSKGRRTRRPRKKYASLQKVLEQQHQYTDSKPCRVRARGIQKEHETVEKRNPTNGHSKVDQMRKKPSSAQPSLAQDMSEVIKETVTEFGGTIPVLLSCSVGVYQKMQI